MQQRVQITLDPPVEVRTPGSRVEQEREAAIAEPTAQGVELAPQVERARTQVNLVLALRLGLRPVLGWDHPAGVTRLNNVSVTIDGKRLCLAGLSCARDGVRCVDLPVELEPEVVDAERDGSIDRQRVFTHALPWLKL